MADPKFKVVITGEAGGLVAAAAQGEAALKKMGGTAQSNAEVAEALKRIGNDAKEMAAETVAAAEKGKRFGGHLQEMKKIAGELSQEFPIAGLALKAFLNPIGAAAAISIGAFVAAKQAIADYLALFKELPNVTTSWIKKLDDWRSATEAGAQSWRDFGKAFQEALNPKETTASKADKDVEAIKTKAATQIAALNRGSTLADKQDGMMVAAGKMTQEEAALRKAQREISYGGARDKINAGATMQEMDVRKREEQRLKDELPLQLQAAEKAKAEAIATDQAKRDAATESDLARTRYQNADSAFQSADAASKPYEENTRWDFVPYVSRIRRILRGAAIDQREQMKGAANQAKDEVLMTSGAASRAGFAATDAAGISSAANAELLGSGNALTSTRGQISDIKLRAAEMGKDQVADALGRLIDSRSAFYALTLAKIEAQQKQIDQFAAKSRQ